MVNAGNECPWFADQAEGLPLAAVPACAEKNASRRRPGNFGKISCAQVKPPNDSGLGSATNSKENIRALSGFTPVLRSWNHIVLERLRFLSSQSQMVYTTATISRPMCGHDSCRIAGAIEPWSIRDSCICKWGISFLCAADFQTCFRGGSDSPGRAEDRLPRWSCGRECSPGLSAGSGRRMELSWKGETSL